MKFISIVIYILLSSQLSFAKNQSTCNEIYGSLDFGSGAMKALVIEVDICNKKILKTLLEENIPTDFNDALEKSTDHTIPDDIVKKLIPTFNDTIKKMRSLNTKSIYAVGTSVFRTAKNGEAVLKDLSQKIGVDIELISQDREAELGYWSALADKGLQPNEKVIVWDIGGGSMQMFTKLDKETHIFKGDLASVTFKNKVISDLQKKDIKTTVSPNPLYKYRKQATELSKLHAKNNVPEFFKKHSQKYRWIGVGGLLSISIQDQVNPGKKTFLRNSLEKTLNSRSRLTDDQIDSKFKTTDISNLALVLGYMNQLKVKEIETARVSLGQGLIFEKIQ